jgi:hypothetical protein
VAAKLAHPCEVEAKQLLIRNCPPEPALAVGDEAVHRNAHRVDQHGLELGAPERRTIIVIKFTIELDIGLFFPLKSALPKLEDRKTKLIVVGRPRKRTAVTRAASRSRERNAGGRRPRAGGPGVAC